MKNTITMVCCAAALIGCKESEVKPGAVASAATVAEVVPSASAAVEATAVPSTSVSASPAVSAVSAEKK